MKEDWIKKTKNNTKEYPVTDHYGIALMTARSLFEKGEYYTSFLILKGLGLNVTCYYGYKFIINKRAVKLRDGSIGVIDTIYSKIIKL